MEAVIADPQVSGAEVMYIISKKYSFEAAHFLPHVPDGHQCKNMHGHSYEVQVWFKSPVLDHMGFVKDFGDLGVKGLVQQLDHTVLNDEIANPTSEALAKWFFDRIPGACRVRVSETPKTEAIYEP